MNGPAPFDRSLPSPLRVLTQLRANASEAVVRDQKPSTVQQLMAPSGPLEDALWDALGREDAPRLLILTGSAGSGKSATMNHLLEREQATREGRIGLHLADATHSDSPDQEQAERLAHFLSDFSDSAEGITASEPCRLIAMNIGMALRFFHDLAKQGSALRFTGLEAVLHRRLNLPGRAAEPPAWLDAAVLVVNLDHRPTAGRAGDLFDLLLQRLDPDLPEGVFAGAARCGTCAVREWCWPMANATAISSDHGRAALNTAAGDIALARGRHLHPRALWDAAAELALSGLESQPAAHTDGDPCFRIAELAAEGAESQLLNGIGCNNALEEARAGTLVAELAARDPSYAPTKAAHELITDTGLAPEEDQRRLTTWLAGRTGPHPAVTHAARILARGRSFAPGGAAPGRIIARAAWFAGELTTSSTLPPEFEQALLAIGHGASSDEPGDYDAALYDALQIIEEGLAEVFGVTSSLERYFPTSSPPPGVSADLLVEAKLQDRGWLSFHRDLALARNPRGSMLVRYRPLVLPLMVDDRSIAVDVPLWRLLVEAAAGTIPSSIELERFLALRQAVRAIGIKAAAEPGHPLLVRDLEGSGRRFRIVPRPGRVLRVTEVS